MTGQIRRIHYNLRNLSKENYFKIGVLVFLITLASFGIGYLVGRDWTPAPIVIEKNSNN